MCLFKSALVLTIQPPHPIGNGFNSKPIIIISFPSLTLMNSDCLINTIEELLLRYKYI